MRLLAMDIPDDPAELPGWLERHLVGLDLAALVAELEAVHGLPTGPVPTVRDVLGDRLDAVLAGGLARLPHEVLGRLLRQPQGVDEEALASFAAAGARTLMLRGLCHVDDGVQVVNPRLLAVARYWRWMNSIIPTRIGMITTTRSDSGAFATVTITATTPVRAAPKPFSARRQRHPAERSRRQ